MTRRVWTALGGGLVAVGTLAAVAGVQDPKPGDEPEPAAKAARPPFAGMPDLVKGLKETPGCLGVETAMTTSGKGVIFAWFEDKKAATAWYDSQMHQKAMFTFMDGPSGREPMAGIPDDVPILTVASITLSARPLVQGIRMPISQIAIEMYAPLPGGISLGGRFAPEALKVPGMQDFTADGKPVAPKAEAGDGR